jgi:tetratricopeptide (TPR) repeat protein
MRSFLTLPALGWLLLPAVLLAQPKTPAAKQQQGIALAQQAKAAYARNDYETAFSAAQEATKLLNADTETSVWCTVLNAHCLPRLDDDDELRGVDRMALDKAEAVYLKAPSRTTASPLLNGYMEVGRRAGTAQKWQLAVMQYTTATIVATHYDPTRAGAIHRQLRRAISEMQRQEGDDDDDSETEKQEEEAQNDLLIQLLSNPNAAVAGGKATLNDPKSWEASYKKTVAGAGANSPEAASVLAQLGYNYHARGDLKTAATRFQQAIQIYKSLGDRYVAECQAAYMGLALVALHTKQYAQVTSALQAAFALQKRLDDRNVNRPVADELRETLALFSPASAVSVAGFAAHIMPTVNDPAIQQLAYDEHLHRAGLLLDARRLNPATTRPTLTWKQVQNNLQANEAAVSFVQYVAVTGKTYTEWPMRPPSFNNAPARADTFYAALVVRSGFQHPRMVRLGTENELRRLLIASETPAGLYGISRGPRPKDISYGESLYEQFWQPAEPHLRGATRVYVSVEGLLGQVALAALPRPGTTKDTPISKRYVGGQYDLHQLVSTRQLAAGMRPFSADKTTPIVLLGGIDYERADTYPRPALPAAPAKGVPESVQAVAKAQQSWFGPLNASGREVKAIARLFPRHTLLLTRNATETQFRRLSGQSPAILHVATHGLNLLPGTPQKTEGSPSDGGMRYTGLVLAGYNRLAKAKAPLAPQEDGALTASEVAGLDLRQTRLVVLSACETGLGSLGMLHTEGIYGLQRAFRMAGVEKMLYTLWPVDDEPTHQFMVNFYTHLAQGRDLREAFRQAQQTQQQQHPDPKHWAGFVLVD